MKNILTLVGIALIILGIGVLGYKGFSYTTTDKVAEVGNMKLTVENEKTVYFDPWVGVASLAAGIILVIVSRRQ